MKQRTTMNAKPGTPGKDDGYWVNLGEVGKIRQNCSRPTWPLAVFYALNLIASEEKSRSFAATRFRIGSLSGLSARSVTAQLAELKRVGVIKLEPIHDAPKGVANTIITLLGEVRL
jgi:hypothetical protein